MCLVLLCKFVVYGCICNVASPTCHRHKTGHIVNKDIVKLEVVYVSEYLCIFLCRSCRRLRRENFMKEKGRKDEEEEVEEGCKCSELILFVVVVIIIILLLGILLFLLGIFF